METLIQDMPRGTRFAVYSDKLKQLLAVASYEGVQSRLGASASDIFTIVPLRNAGGVEFAPVGLTNMLNTGGAISQWREADTGSSKITFQVQHSSKAVQRQVHDIGRPSNG